MKQFFSTEDLDAIAKEIGAQEQTTSGEIRVSIKTKRGWLERSAPIHEMALREFYRLQMHKTRDRSGVLLFFLFKEHQFYVLADEGIHLKAEALWGNVAAMISENFKEGKYREGICGAVRSIGEVLQAHYPRKSDDTNELSNAVELS